jgi:glycosyltransferase involved in cell wall biosynthesis
VKEPNAVDVTFVLPGLVPSGGVRAVFEIADRLADRGLRTCIVVPRRSLLSPRKSIVGVAERITPKGLRPLLQRVSPRKSLSQDWFDLQTPIVPAGPTLWRDLPPSKAVVATSYRTAEELLPWPGIEEHGVYFIQHYETWSGSRRRVDATWRSYDRVVVSSEWLRTMAINRFGRRDVGLASYGVDHRFFAPKEGSETDSQSSSSQPVVGFMWDDRPWKGGEDLLRAVALLRSRQPCRVRAFGLAESPPSSVVAGDIEFCGRLSGTSLADFYRSLDVFMSASWSESGPMTVPEAMACGTPVVATDVGNVRVWSGSENGCVLVPVRNPEVLAGAVLDLLSDPGKRRALGIAGLEAMRLLTWERTAGAFAMALGSFGLIPAPAESNS